MQSDNANEPHPRTIEEYSRQAQIAQLFQYQALYEGFQAKAWVWYTAVIFWKSQSPWPALRGAFYDSVRATSGRLSAFSVFL